MVEMAEFAESGLLKTTSSLKLDALDTFRASLHEEKRQVVSIAMNNNIIILFLYIVYKFRK